MNKRIKIALIGSVFTLGLLLPFALAACQPVQLPTTQNASATVQPQAHVFEASYEYLTLDELIAQADLIVIGQVIDISPARWNQDSGLFWQADHSSFATLPYHQLEIAVSQVLAGDVATDQTLTVTVLGASPAGSFDSQDTVVGEPAHRLQVGQEQLFLLRQGEIAWRGRRQPAILFLGYPGDSYLTQGADHRYRLTQRQDEKALSLEMLQEKIAQKP